MSISADVFRAPSTMAITVIADRFQGKQLNSPNDVVVRSDGSIWFSDPAYGIDGITRATAGRRNGRCNVYRMIRSRAISASLPTISRA